MSEQATQPATIDPVGSEAEFERYLPIAKQLPKVLPMRTDALLGGENACVGAGAVLAREPEMKRLPNVDVEKVREIPAIALALAFAAARAERTTGATGRVAKLVEEGGPLRRMMLFAAEANVVAGAIQESAIAEIRKGSGSPDLAGDLVALVALYREQAEALKNRTPVTPDHLRRAAEIGTELLLILKPDGAKAPTPAEVADAARDRDLLWTLLVERYEIVQRVAGFFWGRDAEDHAPPLGSRGMPARKPAAPTA